MSGSGMYEVRIKRSAEREMNRLPDAMFERITAAILKLEKNPRPRGSQKLRDHQEHRLRVGEYRVLYTIDDASRLIEIVAVGHRRDVYRGM